MPSDLHKICQELSLPMDTINLGLCSFTCVLFPGCFPLNELGPCFPFPAKKEKSPATQQPRKKDGTDKQAAPVHLHMNLPSPRNYSIKAVTYSYRILDRSQIKIVPSLHWQDGKKRKLHNSIFYSL